jgi:hypothetical protein
MAASRPAASWFATVGGSVTERSFTELTIYSPLTGIVCRPSLRRPEGFLAGVAAGQKRPAAAAGQVGQVLPRVRNGLVRLPVRNGQVRAVRQKRPGLIASQERAGLPVVGSAQV